MALLLDTHTFVWLARGDRKITRTVAEAVSDPDARIFVSVISRWEIAIRHRDPELLLKEDFAIVMERSTYVPLDLSFEVPAKLRALPPIHADPFDRLLVAQALHHDMTLVTRDEHIPSYPVKTLW